jgi:hypothetical protein
MEISKDDVVIHTMNTPKHTGWIVSVLVVVVFVLVGGFLYFKFLNSPKDGIKVSDKLPENYNYQVMDYGKYPKNFPTKLIVATKEIAGNWSRSEDTIAGDGKRLKIVELIYKKKTPEILTPLFEKNFKTEGWILDEKRNVDSPTIRVYDKMTGFIGEEATLTIISLGADSLVNITISTK